MKSSTKRKLIGGSLKTTSAAVAAGVPLIMLREIAPVWMAEQGPETTITGVGFIAILFTGLIALAKIRSLADGALKIAKKVKGAYLLCLIAIGLVWLVCIGAQKLYPITNDLITLCTGSAASVGAGFGIDFAAEAINPKKEEKSDE